MPPATPSPHGHSGQEPSKPTNPPTNSGHDDPARESPAHGVGVGRRAARTTPPHAVPPAAAIPGPTPRKNSAPQWRVTRIETEHLDQRHCGQAVTALATLINHWEQATATAIPTQEDAA